MKIIKNLKPREHWLTPFKDKIISIEQLFDDTIEIVIRLTMNELKINFKPELLEVFGIKTLSVETPIEEFYIDSIVPELKHTGEMFVTLLLNPQKANNKDALQIKALQNA